MARLISPPRRRSRPAIPILVLVLAAGACTPAPDPSARPPAGAEPPLTAAELRGAEYPVELVDGGRVRLVDGAYPGTAADRDTAGLSAWLEEPLALGALGPGKPAAAVVLEVSGGGTGTFAWLYLMARVQDTARPIAGALLGDRVEVAGLRFAGDTIVVRLVTHGPADPLCCPTMEVVRRYLREDGVLREVDPGP